MAASTSSLASTQSPAHHQNPVAIQNLSDSVPRVMQEDNALSTNKAAIFQRLHLRVYLERFLEARQTFTWEMDNCTGSVISGGAIWREVSINVGMFLCLKFPSCCMVLENGECSFVRISADLSHYPSRFNWYCRWFGPCKNGWDNYCLWCESQNC